MALPSASSALARAPTRFQRRIPTALHTLARSCLWQSFDRSVVGAEGRSAAVQCSPFCGASRCHSCKYVHRSLPAADAARRGAAQATCRAAVHASRRRRGHLKSRLLPNPMRRSALMICPRRSSNVGCVGIHSEVLRGELTQRRQDRSISPHQARLLNLLR